MKRWASKRRDPRRLTRGPEGADSDVVPGPDPADDDALVKGALRGAGSIFVLSVALVAALVLLVVASLGVGQYSVSFGESLRIVLGKVFHWTPDWKPMAESVIFGLRLPRVLAAALVGAALAVSGAVYQSIFRNPLVSPDLLGVSTGACVGAAVAILLGLNAFGIQVSAFVVGIATVAVTLLIPRLIKSDSNIMLVLAGVIVSGLMGSVLGFIKYIADPETQLASITYWQMGSLAYVEVSDFLAVVPVVAVAAVVVYGLSWWIDVLSMGDEEAKTLGVNVRLVRTLSVVAATLLTASAVCICGTVGWIGLVIPHFARLFVGSGNLKVMPVAALLGAIFLVGIDLVARSLTTVELPLSVLTGFIGAPFYVFLLYRQKGRLQ